MKFTLREKIIRSINKLPKPIVVLIGLVIIFLAEPIGLIVMTIEGVPEFMDTIVELLVLIIGISIWFSPRDYRLLKKESEIIDEEDERRQFINTNAKAKSNQVMQWVFVGLFLISVIGEDLTEYCYLWGGMILIQLISEPELFMRLSLILPKAFNP